MSRRAVRALAAAVSVLLLAAVESGATDEPAPDRPAADRPIVVASKNFAESRLLAELFAQLIEERAGVAVDRRFDLAGTTVCFEALRTGAVDLYPEYTGTGLVTLLGEPPDGDAAAVLRRVRRRFAERWDLIWLAPLGFENAYEIAVPRRLAERLELATISDLVPHAGALTAGFGFEFVERDDGLPGLAERYGLRFGRVETMQQALKVQAAGAGRLDVLDVYTTDGRLLVHDLVVLEDDRGFFPPYAAAPLMRGDTLRRRPEVAAALSLLGGALDADLMRRLNLRLQERGEEPAAVARDALAELGLVRPDGAEAAPDEQRGSGLAGFGRYLVSRRASLARRTGEHLAMTALALLAGVLVALPLGLALERRRRLAEGVIRAVGVTQTIPSIALLAFMIPLFGIGALPAVVALWIYSLFPILRNSYTGVRDADPQAVAAAHALGMTPRQLLLQVRLPLAAPVILAGIRTAAVITVGTATLAAFIGAGGLGQPIVAGLQLADTQRILSGALPAALLALAVDAALGLVERLVAPRGIE